MIAFAVKDVDRAQLAGLPLPQPNDGRDWTGIVVQKPWGSEMQTRQTPEFAATVLSMIGGRETSMHCHPNKTVVLVVLRGAVHFVTLDRAHPLEQGAAALVERGVFHRLRAQLDGAEVLEIEFPPNKFDLVRLEDVYGRGQGYEQCV